MIIHFKKQNLNDRKYYATDLGLANLYRVGNLKFRGDDLETIVYLELLRRGYKVYYYKTSSNQEIDFVLELDNQIVELVQVTKTIENETTKKREIDAFSKAIEELNLEDLKCTLISEDKSKTIDGVYIVNILEWLIGVRH